MRSSSNSFRPSDAVFVILIAALSGWLWWNFPLAMLVTSIAAVVLVLAFCAAGSRSDGGI